MFGLLLGFLVFYNQGDHIQFAQDNFSLQLGGIIITTSFTLRSAFAWMINSAAGHCRALKQRQTPLPLLDQPHFSYSAQLSRNISSTEKGTLFTVKHTFDYRLLCATIILRRVWIEIESITPPFLIEFLVSGKTTIT